MSEYSRRDRQEKKLTNLGVYCLSRKQSKQTSIRFTLNSRGLDEATRLRWSTGFNVEMQIRGEPVRATFRRFGSQLADFRSSSFVLNSFRPMITRAVGGRRWILHDAIVAIDVLDG